jgi:hypothetical protein
MQFTCNKNAVGSSVAMTPKSASARFFPRGLGTVLLLLTIPVQTAFAQYAQLSGVVTDPSGAVVTSASVEIENAGTHARWSTKPNGEGLYVAPSLTPGQYKIVVKAPGFAEQHADGITLNVAGKVVLDFRLVVGATGESLNVEASGLEIDTVDATVSTVVDRRFVENTPLNGRSFQSLMALMPGANIVPSAGAGQSGEISVNGQRTEANYFTVDGVAANTGASVSGSGAPGAGFSGATATSSALGTTQSLVSIDALQEFRASTSTYSAEYGRTPGGQFQFMTKSGTNEFHGSLFDYLRNDVLDARNYFDSVKVRERQNDFGGTFAGPLDIPGLYKGTNRTFFFFAYEGLRLRNPTPSTLYRVPSAALRAAAPAELRPLLAAFPVANGPDAGNGLADFRSGYSSPSAIDTSSIRIDHSFGDNLKIFGRYSDSPSDSTSRQISNPAQVNATVRNVKTATLGVTTLFGPSMTNDLRLNVTGNDYRSERYIDTFGGANPVRLSSLPGMQDTSWLTFMFFYDIYPYYLLEPQANRQRQFNLVDTFTHVMGRHTMKYGFDFRRLTSSEMLPSIWQIVYYTSADDIIANRPAGLTVYRQSVDMKAVFPNSSAFLQDEWKVNRRLNVSLGLRWEINPAPHDANGNTPYTLDQIADLSTAKLAPQGTALWKTTYLNLAPRAGVAYSLGSWTGRDTILRAGAGWFYDTGSTLAAEGYYGVGYYGNKSFTNVPFPLSASALDTTPTPNAQAPYNTAVRAFDPHLKLPYALQWNVTLEQPLGENQSVTVGYVGSAGRRLLAQRFYDPRNNPAFANGFGVYVTANQSSSSYNSLQVRFQRSLSRGLQALVSYSWSHAIDDATSNFTLYNLERASSDYDVRHSLQAALSYDISSPQSGSMAKVFGHWSVDGRVSGRSALPVDLIGTQGLDQGSMMTVNFHPNVVPGAPVYIADGNAPGGRRINIAAFAPAAAGIEGNSGRNFARGFDATQTDLTLRREFAIRERAGLQLRIEVYNLFNHPVFGSIYNNLSNGPQLFGRAYNTQNVQLGGLSPLYQSGGARSIQLALRFHF